MEMQKLELISDIEFWMEARLLAHIYLPEQLKDIYKEIMDKSPIIFDTLRKVEEYLEEKTMNEKEF